MTGFIVTAVLLALCAILFVAWPLLRASTTGQGAQRLSALLAALLIAATASLLYTHLSRGAWRTPPVAAVGEGEGTGIGTLILATQQHPDDLPAWLDLGRGYLRANKWALARRSFRRADRLSGGHSAVALAGLAQTIMFENNGLENDAAIALFERALSIDPHSPQALFYTALALMHQGALPQARERFATMLALGPPAPVADVLRKQIDALDTEIARSSAAAKDNAGTAIHLHVTLAAALQSRVPAGAPLFVFVRSPQGGPPLAVRRLQAGFPQQIELSAADSVIAGNTISKGQHVHIVARVATTGTPTAGAGDLSGEIDAVAGETRQREIAIDKVAAGAGK